MRRNRPSPNPAKIRPLGSMGLLPHNYQYVSEKITKAKEADLICSKPGKK